MTGFCIHEGRDKLLRKRWWVTLTASNGEVLMHSEQLNSKQAAEGNIAAARRAANEADA